MDDKEETNSGTNRPSIMSELEKGRKHLKIAIAVAVLILLLLFLLLGLLIIGH